jgi:hypothetical protein
VLAYPDATGEALAGLLRPGSAAAHAVEDLVWVLSAALVQLQMDPERSQVIAGSDSAGLSHGFIDAAEPARCASSSEPT